MKKIRVLPLLLALLLLFSLNLTAYGTGTPPETQPTVEQASPGQAGSDLGFDATGSLASQKDLSLNVHAALLYETGSGTMVYAYNIDSRVYPASLTKVMTCLVALKFGNLDDTVTVTESALSGMHPDGSNVGLMVGEAMSMREMLYCVMLASANDACPVVAEHISGSEAAFVQLMNEEAEKLGCTNTHFVNTHGLHDDMHYTSARDLLKIFSAALEYDFFRELYSTPTHTVPATNLSGPRELSSTNHMINDEGTPDYIDKRVEGGKTGFTTPAGRCFMCTAKEGDLRYISIVLGSENEYLDNGAIYYHNFLDTEDLLDLGFHEFSFQSVLSPLAPIAQIPVELSPDHAVVAPSETVISLLPNDFQLSEAHTSYTLNSGSLTAPLAAQQVVGTAEFYYRGICVARSPLVTVAAVKENAIAYHAVRAAQSLAQSPWKLVVLILMIVLGLFLILWVRAIIIQSRMRRRRKRYRRR